MGEHEYSPDIRNKLLNVISHSGPKVQRSLRLQSRANTAVLRTPLLPSASSSSDSTLTWLPCSSAMDKSSSTTSATNNSSRNGGARPRQPLLGTIAPALHFEDKADLSVTNMVNHESNDVTLDQSNNGFSFFFCKGALFRGKGGPPVLE